jgi:hypothetical protein
MKRIQMNPLEFAIAALGIDPEKAALAFLKSTAFAFVLFLAFRFGQILGH